MIEQNTTAIQNEPITPPHLLEFAKSMQIVVESVKFVDSQLDQFHRRQELRDFYADGLIYRQIIDLKITKAHLCPYFTNPKTREPMQPNQKRISIRWCVHQKMARHFWDRWWMVFDYPPHRNYEVPFYFLKKLYCEFVMHQKPNYFDIKLFQGVGHGMPQHRLGAQSNNPLPDPPIVPLVAPSIPIDVQNTSFISTLDDLASLTGNLSEQAAHMASIPRWIPHMCSSCHETCVGPTVDPGSSLVPAEHDATDDSMMTSYMDFICFDDHLDQV